MQRAIRPPQKIGEDGATVRARYSLGPASVPNVLGTDLVARARAPTHRYRIFSSRLNGQHTS